MYACKRLKKASKLAEELDAICERGLDKASCFEVTAYTAGMRANYQMEASRFEDAMESLLVSKTVYELLKNKKDPDSIEAIVYSEKIEQVVTFVRKTAMDLGVMSVTDNQIMEYKEAAKM